MYINWVKSLVFLVAISVFGLFGCSNKENTGGSGDNFTIAFVAPTDPDDATVDRDWTEVAVSIGSALPTSSFIDFDHSLLAYLNFNGVAGSNAADLSSYGNAGTVEGDRSGSLENSVLPCPLTVLTTGWSFPITPV